MALALYGRGHDVLVRVVEERGAGVILGGPGGPGRLEHLVRVPPEQDRPARVRDAGDGLAHPGVERIVECPARRVDDPVERDELVYPDSSHDHLLVELRQLMCSSVWTARLRESHRRDRPGPGDHEITGTHWLNI